MGVCLRLFLTYGWVQVGLATVGLFQTKALAIIDFRVFIVFSLFASSMDFAITRRFSLLYSSGSFITRYAIVFARSWRD